MLPNLASALINFEINKNKIVFVYDIFDIEK